MSMFTIRQKLLLCGSVLIAALLIAGSYFGSRWLFGPDVEPTLEHVSTARPAVATSVSPDTLSVSETDWVSELEQTLSDADDTDSETESNSIQIEDELEAQLAALSDEELTALAEALEQDEGESSKYPPVPEGFPSNLKPVWLKDYFDEDSHANHVTMYRVLIELWNQGDRGFVNGIIAGDNGRVYPLYHDVVYVEWDSYVYDGPDGEPIELPYISSELGTENRGLVARPITMDEIRTKYPNLKLVDYDSAGYDPATILDDY